MTKLHNFRLWPKFKVFACPKRLSGFHCQLFLIILSGSFLLNCVNAFAGSITAELESNVIGLGDQTTLSIAINGSLDDDLVIPEVEGIEFRQQGTSTNVQIVNGSFSKETVYSYVVNPLRAGVFKIPSLQVKLNKEEAATPPLTLTVNASSNVPGAPSASQQKPEAEAGGSGRGAQDSASSDFPVQIERSIAKQTLYEGEAVLSTIRIFQRGGVRIRSLVPERDPAPDWRIISKEGQKTFQTNRGGVPWQVTEITEVLIPLKAGPLVLPKFSLRANYLQPSKRAQRRTGTIWDMLGNGAFDMGEEISKKISSDSQKLTIKKLPSDGRPSVVSDMVGDFKVAVEVSKRTLNPQETATVTVTVTGRGSLDRMAEMRPPSLIGAKVYADKPQLKEKIDDEGLLAERRIKFAVVPSGAGSLDLGKIEFGSFDPVAGQWKSLVADLGVIQVQGASSVANQKSLEQVPSGNSPGVSSGLSLTPSPEPGKQPVPPVASEVLAIPSLKQENSIIESRWSTTTWFAITASAVGGVLIFYAAGPARTRWKRRLHKTKTPFQSLAGIIKRSIAAGKSGGELAGELILQLKTLAAGDSQLATSLTAADLIRSLEKMGVEAELVQFVHSAVDAIERKTYQDIPIADQDVVNLKDVLTRLADSKTSGLQV